jgi:hypothetical protein
MGEKEMQERKGKGNLQKGHQTYGNKGRQKKDIQERKLSGMWTK